MAIELIRSFLGTRVSGTGNGTWQQLFAIPTPNRDGVLFFNDGSGDIDVNDNNSDASPWYRIPSGATKVVPFPSGSIYIKTSGAYKAQEVTL